MTLTANTTGSAPLANVLTIPVSCAGATIQPPSCVNHPDSLTTNDTIIPITDTFVLSLGAAPIGTAAPTTQTTSIQNSGTITYTAPPGFLTCDIFGNDINNPAQPCTPVTFTYTLQSTMAGGGGSQSNVTVKVNATTSFSQGGQAVYATLAATTCAGACHDNVAVPVDCNANPADSHCKWQDTGSAAGTLMQLTSAACTYTTTNGKCIVNGNPSTSQLYLNGCVVQNPDFHPYRLQPGQCAILSRWLAEGAHLN
jgi:hypothetical protein